jgi:uncharacterized membrane protein YhiD involved in acid resistance
VTEDDPQRETTTLLVRLMVAFALTFALGFERELRGSLAGDRTFSLIGIASAVLGNAGRFTVASAAEARSICPANRMSSARQTASRCLADRQTPCVDKRTASA